MQYYGPGFLFLVRFDLGARKLGLPLFYNDEKPPSRTAPARLCRLARIFSS